MKAINAKNGLPMRRLAGGCALAMILTLSQAGIAQQSPTAGAAKADASKFEAVPMSSLLPGAATARPAARPNAEEESAKPDKAAQQHIKVHGHWVLQVKNADGTLGERHEFDNSLVTDEVDVSGDQLLAGLLSGNLTPSDPGIAFVSFADTATQQYYEAHPSIDCPPTDSTAFCFIFTTSRSVLNSIQVLYPHGVNSTGVTAVSTGLQVQAQFQAQSSSPIGWVLSGIYTVPAGMTSISVVETLLGFCVPASASLSYFTTLTGHLTGYLTGTASNGNADYGPTQCVASNVNFYSINEYPSFGALTATVIPNVPATGMAVTPGQVLVVTVTISFS